MKVGVFDHLSLRLGGSQLVVAWMAALLSSDHDVELIHEGRGYSATSLATTFGVDLSRVRERIVGGIPPSFARSLRQEYWEGRRFDRRLTEGYDLFIYSGHGVPPLSWARHGLVYCHFPFESQPALEMRQSHRWERRSRVSRWLRTRLYALHWRRRLLGYDAIIANSRFTAAWIEQRWGQRADVVYPPVVMNVPATEKRNVIVSLGRFVQSDRKNAAAQIEAFARVRGRIDPDWRLHMIGFCADLPEDRAYLARLRAKADGLPITFIVNAPRTSVLAELAVAKLFWHTAGVGELATIDPSYLEHFGIATVEAMLAGCVPIVPAGGGQSEIVENGVSGFVCRDLEHLVQYTAALAAQDELWGRMSAMAVERGRAFGPDVFTRSFHERVMACLGMASPLEARVAGKTGVSPLRRRPA